MSAEAREAADTSDKPKLATSPKSDWIELASQELGWASETILQEVCRADVADPHAVAAKVTEIARTKFDPAQGTFLRFVRGIVSNLARSEKRRSARLSKRQAAVDIETEVEAESASEVIERLVRHLDRPGLRQAVARAWSSLPHLERRVLWLRFWKNKTYGEIAALSEFRERGLTVSAMKCRLSRAYRTIRPSLAPFHPRPGAGCRKHRSKNQSGQGDAMS